MGEVPLYTRVLGDSLGGNASASFRHGALLNALRSLINTLNSLLNTLNSLLNTLNPKPLAYPKPNTLKSEP